MPTKKKKETRTDKAPGKQKAVIYCRVSSTKQTTEGDGLASQETRCREYAKYKSYVVAEVFRDDVSGGMIDRPGMQAMLRFLRGHRKEHCVVIIDDISRLARGLEAHLRLRTAIGDAGGKLESPSIEFGEDSDSILVENLLASVSQHQRQKNGEQTKNRMRARAMNGYWVFRAVPGYRFKRTSSQGKILIRDEPVASVIAEALNGYATGRFESQGEVKRFLEASGAYPTDRKGEVHLERVKELLTRPVYAGRIDFPNWGIHLQPAKHDGLISFETYQAVQRRLQGAVKAPARKDLSEDFPLRGFVTCGHCNRPMTACWSKGRSATYPYYLCQTKGCTEYRKSIRKEQLEAEFEALLLELRPSPGLLEMASEMLRELWEAKTGTAQKQAQSLESEVRGIERKVEQLMDRIVEAESETLITAYESRIRALEERKVVLSEKIANCGRPLPDYQATVRTALTFLGNPQKLWASERLEDKRAVLKLVFAERLPYVRNEGYRTAGISLPFRVLEGLKGGKREMVPPSGLEPERPFGPGILSPMRLPIPPRGPQPLIPAQALRP